MDVSGTWDGTPHWEKEPEVAERFIRYIDPNVESRLTNGAVPRDIIPHGASFWTRTAQILAAEEDGSPISFFLKDPTWCDTWEESFSRNIDIFFEHELKAQGPDEEIAQLREIITKRVIPRLLRPMETGGRKVAPRLIHGDLWEGNAGTDLVTAIPKIYDACSWYAHNEFEMAPWRPARQKMGKPYVRAYLDHFPVSESVADFDGRNALYALRFNLCSSGLYPGNLNYRNVVRNDMRELIERFPESFEEWEKEQTSWKNRES
ncbi:putative protein-ribulosamine 3-kinase [Seiridium cardinale]